MTEEAMKVMVEEIAQALAAASDARWDAQNFNETPSGESPEEMRDHFRSLAQAAAAVIAAAMAADKARIGRLKAENERLRGPVTTYQKGFGPGDGESRQALETPHAG